MALVLGIGLSLVGNTMVNLGTNIVKWVHVAEEAGKKGYGSYGKVGLTIYVIGACIGFTSCKWLRSSCCRISAWG
jgi:hypothetical protein